MAFILIDWKERHTSKALTGIGTGWMGSLWCDVFDVMLFLNSEIGGLAFIFWIDFIFIHNDCFIYVVDDLDKFISPLVEWRVLMISGDFLWLWVEMCRCEECAWSASPWRNIWFGVVRAVFASLYCKQEAVLRCLPSFFKDLANHYRLAQWSYDQFLYLT